jgi:uncharacterized cupin superfamily protein
MTVSSRWWGALEGRPVFRARRRRARGAPFEARPGSGHRPRERRWPSPSALALAVVIEKGFFTTKAEAMDDIRASGFWPTTYISDKSPELPLHYHDHDIIGYVMEGETYLLDEDGDRVPIGPGDRLDIPKGAWHAEGEVTERVIYLVTVREAVPFLEAILPREPKGPFPSFD